jgi:signal transduction histidine kinase/CheY-like chemotaxis protein
MSIRLALFSIYLTLVHGLFSSLQAQEVEIIPLKDHLIRISYWSENDGLPTWHINEIVQDKRGLTWLGTQTGLWSFDGKKFRQHNLDRTRNSTPNILRMILDTDQKLWLFSKTESNKYELIIYDPFIDQPITQEISDTSKHVNHFKPLFLRDGKIYLNNYKDKSIGYIGKDKCWHTTALLQPDHQMPKVEVFPNGDEGYWLLPANRKRLELWNNSGELARTFPLPPQSLFLDFKIDASGLLYLFYAGEKELKFPLKVLRCSTTEGPTPVSHKEICHLNWFATDNYGYKLLPNWANNSSGINVMKLPNHSVNVYNGDTLIYPKLNRHFIARGLENIENRIISLQDNSFWMVGLSTIIRIEVLKSPFINLVKNFEKSPSTRGIALYHNQLYINSYSGLLNIQLGNLRASILSEEQGRGLFLQEHKLWSSMHSSRVFCWDLTDLSLKIYPIQGKKPSEGGQVYISPNGNFYIGCESGIYHKNVGDSIFQWIEGVTGKAFHQNKHGLWIAGSKGIWLIDSLNQTIQHFKEEISINGQLPDIRHLYEDGDGIFWLATNTGLWRWRPYSSDIKIILKEPESLRNNLLHAVYEDRLGRLWIPSDGGLICYNKRQNQYRTFTKLDGLPSSEFNELSHFKDGNGILYFGGIKGLVSLMPESIDDQLLSKNSTQIFSIKLITEKGNQQLISHRKESGYDQIIVTDDISGIEIKFFNANYVNERLIYRWRISEIDSNWTYLEEPQFTLYKLPYGTHSLEIDAFIAGNSKSDTKLLTLTLLVTRPFYLQLWFLVTMIICLTGMIALLFRFRQRKLRQLSSRLAIEVAEKTAQLRQDRDLVNHQKESLREMSEERSRFFHDLSHEFRNPLTLIIGPANDLIKHSGFPAIFKPKLKQIKRNAQKIQGLIEEVLELSKLEAGVILVDMSPLQLGVFIQRLCQDFEGSASHKRISLQVSNTISDSLFVRTDRRKLEKIISNLIQNALKYTLSEGSVHVKAQWTPQGFLDVWVSDTGIGIDSKHWDRIFERYYQIPSSSNLTDKSGFGVGLSICKHYTTLLGGSISVYSKVGVGTNFHLTIPCEVIEARLEAGEEPSPLLAGTPTAPDQKCILLIDDQREILDYVASIIPSNYKIFKAYNGEQAIGISGKEQVDLIISDLLMDGMNGLDLLTWVRQNDALKHIPFILLTGVDARLFQVKALELGVSEIVGKPVESSTLVPIINRIMEGHKKDSG